MGEIGGAHPGSACQVEGSRGPIANSRDDCVAAGDDILVDSAVVKQRREDDEVGRARAERKPEGRRLGGKENNGKLHRGIVGNGVEVPPVESSRVDVVKFGAIERCGLADSENALRRAQARDEGIGLACGRFCTRKRDGAGQV